jgi:DNA repair protein RadC
MKRIKDLPVSERPREKLLEKGAVNLSDEELLAVILSKGTRNIDVLSLAKKIIKEVDDKGITISANELQDIAGMGAAKSALVAAAFEFVRRRIKPEGVRIQNPEDVIPLVRHYADRRQEHFIVVSLNGAHEVINVRVITKGLLNRTQVHPREVFAEAIADRAAAVILAHNHTSTNLTPSEDDIKVTERLVEAGNILGIKVLDHLVFNEKGYTSIDIK